MLAAGGGAASAQETIDFKVATIDHVSIQVADLERSVAFYHKMFDFSVISQDRPLGIIRLGVDRTLVSLNTAAFLPANAGGLRRQLAIWQKTGRSIWALTPPGYRPLRAIFQDIPASRKSGVMVVTRIAESADHEPFETGQRHWQYYLRQVEVPNGD